LLALGATIIGPRNVELERQNPNLLRSLYTYAGIIPNMKLSFADARNRLLIVGWAREVTQRELARGHHRLCDDAENEKLKRRAEPVRAGSMPRIARTSLWDLA
jgi:hypothetical protein